MSEEGKERRRFARLPVGIMIRIKSEKDAEAFVTNYTRDLSLGGMFLKSLTPKPVGTPVLIELPCVNPPGYTEIHGKVVYQNLTTEDGLLAGMGIEFTQMADGAKSSLLKFINDEWRQLFRAQIPDETAIAGAINALVGMINFLMKFLNNGRE